MRSTTNMKKLALAFFVVLSVAACGGANNSGKPNSPPGTSSAVATATTRSSLPGKQQLPQVAETVRSTSPGAAWRPAILATPGESVQFRTVHGGKSPADIRLVFAQGRGHQLTATATADGHSSQATVNGTAGAHLTLLGLHYTCPAPPAPSFCPIHNVSTTATSSSMTFKAPAQTPIFITATVGPATVRGLRNVASSHAVVPPYKVISWVKTIVPGTNASKAVVSPLRSSVAVKPGELVFLLESVRGRLKGAPQRLGITVGQGPAASLTASASFPGASPSVVLIKSSDGSPITLVVPRYTCYVPPAPTYCPPVSAGVSGGNYKIDFLASPTRPAVFLLISVDPG